MAIEIPEISFQTDEWTRRSMTLNGMRMTTEYSATGSKRVLQLIDSRLAAQQNDVVHDVLVYLINQILDARAEETEERLLRAEALASFLNLDKAAVNQLLLNPKLQPDMVKDAIEAGDAGPLRRAIEVAPLVENQYQILEPVVRQRVLRERKWLELIEEIAGKI